MWKIDTDDVNTSRPGKTAGETWNGFDVVYVTAETLATFVVDNGGTVSTDDNGTMTIAWPAEWGAEDDTFDVGADGLYCLMGWCVEIDHTHGYRADIAD